jgi:hypothetical protein
VLQVLSLGAEPRASAGASAPPGALTFKDIIARTATACAAGSKDFDRAAMALLTSAVSYYRIRQLALSDPSSASFDRRRADGYQALAVSANDLVQRALSRGVPCDDLVRAIRTLLVQMNADPRDATYVEMNREVRAYYDALLAIQTAPTRPSLRSSAMTIGVVGLAVALGTAAAVVMVRRSA